MAKSKAEFLEFKLYDGRVTVKFYPKSHRYYVGGKRCSSVTSFISVIDKSRALVPWAVGLYKKFLLVRLCDTVPDELSISQIRDAIERGAVEYDSVREEAADIGTEIHEWVEKYVKNQIGEIGYETPPETPGREEVGIGVRGFLEWVDQHHVKFLSSEKIVYSLAHGFIGTDDILAIVDGKRCVVDIKSSNGLYNTVRLQTAGYARAEEEESGKKVEGRWAVRVAKETEVEYHNRMQEKGKTEYPPYRAFEALYLDTDPGSMEEDFQSFLACKTLYEWNNKTDFYKLSKKKDWIDDLK